MQTKQSTFLGIGGLLSLAFLLAGCDAEARKPANPPAAHKPLAHALPSEAEVEDQTIRFLEDRVKRDPEDFIAYNKLVEQYLQRVRNTGDITYLTLASKAAHASLATLPAERNIGGLTALAQVEYASHDFMAARDHARQLAELDPDKSYPYQILGDALLELGDYREAEDSFRRMQDSGGVHGMTRVAIEQRVARLAALRGDSQGARRHMDNALTTAESLALPPQETIAWCHWQLGEIAFGVGDYPVAEGEYRRSLAAFPNYFRALASLGRVLAARGDIRGATEQYAHAVRIVPDPAFLAALGDLYKIAGRDKDAAAQYALVEKIGDLNAFNGTLYNRQLAVFYADHDLKTGVAYQQAYREYSVRRDIYGSDALAWSALKAGRLSEARTAIRRALRLGTRDARLFYHAGMIARATGDKAMAITYLRKALALSPQFDPLQAAFAREGLRTMTTPRKTARAS